MKHFCLSLWNSLLWHRATRWGPLCFLTTLCEPSGKNHFRCWQDNFQQELLKPFSRESTCSVFHLRESGSNVVLPCEEIAHTLSGYKGSEPTVLHSTRDEGSNLAAGSVDYLLAQFAQWVFGPTGLPTFRLIAYGDFSYEGRFVRHNVLLCRDESTLKRSFRTLAVTDTIYWALL
jgi:hypothetical protein